MLADSFEPVVAAKFQQLIAPLLSSASAFERIINVFSLTHVDDVEEIHDSWKWLLEHVMLEALSSG